MCNGEFGKSVKVSFEIEIRPNSPDQNGVSYSEESIRQIANCASGKPIVIHYKDGTNRTIGVLSDAVYDGKKIFLNGHLKESGTCEDVILKYEANKIVETADFKYFGIVAD